MSIGADKLIWIAGGLPLAIPLLRIVFSSAIVFRVGVLTSILSMTYLVAALAPDASWNALWMTGGPLTARFAWPMLQLPTMFAAPPIGLTVLIKVFFLAMMLGFRQDKRGWWWPLLDGMLCLMLCAADLVTYLTFWSISAGIALLWIARQMDGPSEENSEILLRFGGLIATGFGLLVYSLLLLASAQSGFGDPIPGSSMAWPGIWLACLLLGAGSSFQASETVGVVARRNALAAFLVALALPSGLLLIRLTPVSGELPHLVTVLAAGVVVGGICSFRSQTMEGMLAGSFICSESALLLALCLGADGVGKSEMLVLHFAPFAVLFSLLAPIPAFLQPQKRFWIGSLRGTLRKALAGISMAFLAFQLGTLPFGFQGFPFQRLLQESAVTGLVVCLGLLAAAGGTLSILGGFWFADLSARWPTKTYTDLARRYFRV